jgi:hypothetical protein
VALRKFAVSLISCANTIKEIGFANKANSPDTLKKIILRLPYVLRRKWRSRADNITEKEDREIQIEDIAQFVEAEARAATHPIFGDITDIKHNDKGRPSTTKSKVLAAHSEQGQSYVKQVWSCLLCNENHSLIYCFEFKKLSVEDRSEFVKKNGLCFNCLIPKHRAKECKRKPACNKCSGKHATLLHMPYYSADGPQATKQNGSEATNGFIGIHPVKVRSKIGLPILPVKVKAKNGNSVITYAFLDNGSDSTFCTKSLVHRLGLVGRKTKLSLTTLEKSNSMSECEIVDMEVYDIHENVCFDLPTVFTRSTLPVSTNDIPTQQDIENQPHLQHITIPYIEAPVDLLIGNDNAHVIQPTEIIQSDGKGPYAVKTAFGWAINGPLGSFHYRSQKANFIKVKNPDEDKLSIRFQEFCNMEFNDLRQADTQCSMSQDDKKALEIMENSIQWINGHYQLGLPWKEYPPDLQNNKSLAEHRLNLLKRRFKADPELLGKYSNFMANLLEKGYAQQVPKDEIDTKLVWYLPHHPVFHPQKPGKVRVVFDCSVVYRNNSLNESLLQGPDLTNSLLGVLMRFRQEPVAIMADVEAMFYQVNVEPKDQDMLRFLWWPEGKLYMAPVEYRMTVHLFGATSSPSCCNFALRKTAIDNKAEFNPDVINAVHRNFYVDDLLKSTKSEEEGIQLVQDLCLLLSKGGFKLTKWTSNSKVVEESVAPTERAVSLKPLELESACRTMPRQRALGMQWNTDEDTLGFNVKQSAKSNTRRGILSILSSVYDPLGLASPFILLAKILLQDLSRLKLGWDQEIPTYHTEQWEKWLAELYVLDNFTTNRSIQPPRFGSIVSRQLHHFSDASELGYGSASYIRLVNINGEIHCCLLMSKSRVAPLKQTTIPRLELAAATVSVRVDRMLREELDFPLDASWFWTDSTAVLKCIGNTETRFRTYVANRLAIIHDGSNASQWKHIPSRQNPADDVSRGLTGTALLRSKRWLSGPEFLWHTEDHWPSPPNLTQVNLDSEIKQSSKVSVTHVGNTFPFMDSLIQRFSSWYKLRKCVAWILRYKDILLEACRSRKEGRIKKHSPDQHASLICVEEMDRAEMEILKYVQQQHFPKEIMLLREPGSSVSKASTIARLSPILKEGLLRVGGRLNHALIPYDSKHQIILPKSDPVTSLIIKHYHQESGHSGREYALSLVRRRFWVIRGNSAVRKVLSNCFQCRQLQGQPMCQKMAELPTDRVIPDEPPFSSVGIDYFGPFMVKRGRSEIKKYGCIFTCLTIRAVHIEVADTLDTDSFINALRRFIARRGIPKFIRSDNGSNFIGAEKELKDAIMQWNKNCIHEFLLQRSVKWHFNPPYASQFGGVWERCIRTVRKVLRSLLKEQTLHEENLVTFLCEVEAIINGRPITKASDDPKDSIALTPNDLLLLCAPAQLPPGIFVKEDTYVRRRWRQVQYLADQFWKRWVREYLPLLQQRQKWLSQKQNLAVGDLVLLVEENTPRGQWAKGLVQEVFPDRYGTVRQAMIKTASGLFRRDIRKLCLLEHDIAKF